MRRICVYCGSSVGNRPEFAAAARRLGTAMAERGLELVYGGGGIGLMGVIADAALIAGGRVTGVIPRTLVAREQAHPGGVAMHYVDTMHERKAKMAALADAFVAMPGGYGTLEELFETVTWAQLGIHKKPCALYNVGGYYDPLLEILDRAVVDGFIKPEFREFVFHEQDPERLLDRLATHRLPAVPIWLRAGQI
jgi:uncharacterized protein (TIGR00730 family)